MEKEDLKKFMEYDYYATPLFDGLQLVFSKENLEKSGNADIFPGAYLYHLVNTFIPRYQAKCEDYGEEPQEIVHFGFEDVVPYCSAVTASLLFDDILACMLYMLDNFDRYKELIIDNIVKSDALHEIAKQIDDDSDLRWFVEFFAEFQVAVDKIIMYDYSMGQMVLDEKWQEIADALNVYVDKLNDAQLAEGLKHFTADDAQKFSKLADLYAIEPIKLEENGKWGLVDVFGQTVLPCEWNYIDEFHEGYAVVADKDNKAGYVNTRGELVIPCIWNLALGFEGGFAVVSDDEDRYGIINKKGELIIPCKWRFATPFENGLAKVQDFDEHWFVIDPDGNTTRVYTYSERKAMGILTEEELEEESQARPSFPPFPRFDEPDMEDPGPF